MRMKLSLLVSSILILGMALSGCQNLNDQNDTPLHASGTISATQVDIAALIGGTVTAVNVTEGQQVKKGDELFRLDDTLLKAQWHQANDAVGQAEAALTVANVQYEIALNLARLQDQQNKATEWNAANPTQFDLPVWYYDKNEKITSAQAEVENARLALSTEEENLQKILSADASQEFISAEKRLADAQTAFIIAGRVLSQAKSARDKEELQSFAQDQYDAAENELNSAQDEYNKLLTNQAVQDVHDGRARVRVAQKRYDLAQDYYSSLLTGTQSLQVKLAEAGVKQAEAALATAKSALAVLDVQLQKQWLRLPSMESYSPGMSRLAARLHRPRLS